MDEQMMNMFSLIADQVRNKQDLFNEEGKIMQALLNKGYHLQEADAALMLMQTLAQGQSESLFTPVRNPSPAVSMRAMSREERDRITVEAFGFASKLARLGIISEDQREELLEKALTVYSERIELDHIKSLIAFALFVQPQEYDPNAFPSVRRIKKTAWN